MDYGGFYSVLERGSEAAANGWIVLVSHFIGENSIMGSYRGNNYQKQFRMIRNQITHPDPKKTTGEP